MDAEKQCNHRHDDQRVHTPACRRLLHKLVAEPDCADQQSQVQPMPRGQDQRVAADAPGQLAECDDRARKSNGTDQDTNVSLNVMNRFFDAEITFAVAHEVGKAHRDCRGADEAVQDRNELGHLRHLHSPREYQADGAADQQRDDQLVIVGADFTEQGREQCDGHASDAVPVTAPGRFLVGQPAQREDEQDGRDDVRDIDDSFVDHGSLTS